MLSRRVFSRNALLSLWGLAAAGRASAGAPVGAMAGARGPDPADPYRPALHYSPPRGFMNDPNGLVYADGEWHLFFQHNPFAPHAGHVHWGHAVSRDLLHWQTLPLALSETPAGQAFSGSAVVDRDNTSGLFPGKPGGLVAVYTRAGARGQAQAIASSADGGRTFTDFPGNPVLDVGSDQFRDPKVFWHAPTRRWVMAVVRAREHRVLFYGSADLKAWQELGAFADAGVLGVDYECPDLVEVPVVGGGSRWVLFLSINPGAPLGGSAVQFFVGGFDGARFVPEDRATRFVDFGKDFYALQTFGGVDGAPVGLAWMNNWQYCNELPTGAWRGAMTLARRLRLRRRDDDWQLLQEPVGLEAAPGTTLAEGPAAATTPIPPGVPLDVTLGLDISEGTVTSLRFANAAGEYVEVGFDASPAVGAVWLDRGATRGFRQRFFTDKVSWSPPAGTRRLELRLVFDRCSLELFALDGAGAATLLHFFAAPPDRLLVQSQGTGARPFLRVRALG